MKKFAVLLVTLVALMVAPVMAQSQTIAEIVVAQATSDTPEFTTLLSLVQAADPAVLEALSGEGTFTVFAPTDAAFAALTEALGEAEVSKIVADQKTLTNILLYHVLPDEFDSATLMQIIEFGTQLAEQFGIVGPLTTKTLLGQSLDITADEDGVYVDNAKIVMDMVDIKASNGIIHVIDAVLVPESRTIAEIVMAAAEDETPEFTTLLAAVSAAGLVDAVSNPEATLTVFAPTDAAFAALKEALGEEAFNGILADTEALTNILLYHVVGSVIVSSDLPTTGDSVEVEMLNGGKVSYRFDMEKGLLLNDSVRIIWTDIDASNGIIHVIDTVLVPPTE